MKLKVTGVSGMNLSGRVVAINSAPCLKLRKRVRTFWSHVDLCLHFVCATFHHPPNVKQTSLIASALSVSLSSLLCLAACRIWSGVIRKSEDMEECVWKGLLKKASYLSSTGGGHVGGPFPQFAFSFLPF